MIESTYAEICTKQLWLDGIKWQHEPDRSLPNMCSVCGTRIQQTGRGHRTVHQVTEWP